MSDSVAGAATANRYGMYIDGEFVESSSGETRQSISPSSGEAWAEVPEGNAEDVNRAVVAARKAQKGEWGSLLPRERGELLHKMGDAIEANAERLAELDVRDVGKTIREMTGQYSVLPQWWRYFGSLADKIDGRVHPADRDGVLNYTTLEPLGVTAGITPWNSPGLQATYKAAPSLAAGNTVVIKPSEQTPVVTLELAKLAEEVGIPAGAFNVVTGAGPAGAALAGHPGVELVAFTGSDATGAKVGAAAGGALSGIILELGGKSPQVIFGDADLDAAEVGVMTGICVASGQSCIAGSRVYVHSSIAEELTERLIARFASLRLGDPLDWDTEVGPVCFGAQLDRITHYCDLATQDGAKAVVGGKRPSDERLSDGYYFEPTIFTGVDNRMRIMREEVFGPVMGLTTFDTEEEAIALANDTKYGLCAGVWTADISRALRVTKALDAGTIWVNTYRVVSSQTPFAGAGDSGVGFENGVDVLRSYTRPKAVWIDHSGAVRDPFRI